MNAPLALYRRYRPETYAEVIGQDHVTEPLRRALTGNRVNHAYLFSGPRGCGKTTSARILARCLNCEKGPTPDPCGSCQSCLDLARGGSGSIDVIEIDAASHGGVDDARDLRERAFFAPVSSQYKIYIVDEAHMVTTQGFNALLKLVEEPPEHLKFIFATTEPEKVIGTIRSRTHHYPFRLVPPKVLSDYLAELCERERIAVEPAALPLVVRAGGGSVRDTLSVLDQLIGGAGHDGVTYAHAVALLGYTHAALLDEVVEALAAHDGAGVFACIDRVIESGQDPKRFAEDLLHRLRDLVILSAVPDAASTGLVEGGPDEAERLAAQAGRFGTAALARAAAEINTGLTEMRGATAPRLHLELLCARVLLPAVDESEHGLAARLDQLERRLAAGAVAGAPPAVGGAAAQPPVPPVPPSEPPGQPAAAAARQPSQPGQAAASPPQPSAAAAPAEQPSAQPAEQPVPSSTEPPPPQQVTRPEARQATGPQGGQAAPEPAGELGLSDVRRAWPAVLDAIKDRRRLTWSLLSHNAQVTDLHAGTLTVALVNAGARDSFARSGSEEILREGLQQVLGVNWRIEAIVDPSTGGGRSGGSPGGSPRGPADGGSSSGGGATGPYGGGSAGGSGAGSSGPSSAGGQSGGRDASAAPPQSAAGGGAAVGGAAGHVPVSPTAGSASSPPVSTDVQAPSGAPAAAWPAASPLGGGTGPGPGPGVSQGSPRHPAPGSPQEARPANGSPSVPAGSPAPGPFGDPAQELSRDPVHDPDADVDPETDAVATEAATTHTDLLVREFGAEIVEEFPTD